MLNDFYQKILVKKMLPAICLFVATTGMANAGPESERLNAALVPGVSASQQVGNTVSGVVIDNIGEPVIGANVIEKGTTNGTITDLDGQFSLDVSAGATLVISYIGYLEQQISVGNQKVINVTLQENTQALEEVVVVAYGAQKKVNMTGSVASISSDVLESRPVTNVSTALAGVAAGVRVNQTSARPGDDGATIRVRGQGALNNDNAGALVIIDGIPGTLDAVNPNDIQSISILKDAASSAIYGTRAANGVILVTTKRGTTGKPKVNFTGTISLAQPTRIPEFVNDYATYMETFNRALTSSGSAERYSENLISLWREKSKDPNGLTEYGVPNYIAYANTDWADAIFENNWIQNYNLSVTGGSENTKYAMSAGYLNNPGIINQTGAERFQFRVNLESRIAKFLTLGTQTFMSKQRLGIKSTENSNFNYLRQSIPGQYPYMFDGYWAMPSSDVESPQVGSNLTSGWNNTAGRSGNERINTTLFARFDIIKGLTFETKVNYQQYRSEKNTYPITQYRKNFLTDFDGGVVSDPTSQTTTYSWSKNYTLTYDNVLNYQFDIKKTHNFNILLGHNEYYYNTTKDFSASKKGLLSEGMYVPDAAADDIVSFKGHILDRAMRSYFGRVNYDYKSKYLFEFNLRYDASSRFGENKRWGAFPSISGAWRITEESFAEPLLQYFQNLKLRGSWGRLGSDNSGDYDYQAVYGSHVLTTWNGTLGGTYYSFGGSPIKGLAQQKMANQNLHWEETEVIDIALEGIMLDSRATFELDFYSKYTKGILTTPDIPGVAGEIKGPTMNTANILNRGVEITLGWRDRIDKVNYRIQGNFAYNYDKVKKYKGKLEENEDGTNNLSSISTNNNNGFILEGSRIHEFYLRELYSGNGSYFNPDGSVNINGGPKDGMIRTEKDLQWVEAMKEAGYKFSPYNNVSKQQLHYGDYIYADLNGDGTYGSVYDRSFTGKSSLPKYNYGFNIDVDWNNFDLSMIWAGSAGFHYYFLNTGYNAPFILADNAIPAHLVKDSYYYNFENPNDPANNMYASNPRMIVSSGSLGSTPNTVPSTKWLYNASYLKLKNLQLGYTIPSHITNKWNIGLLRVFVTGENLLMFTKYPFMDPESGSGIGYLPMKQFAFGLNVNF